MRLLRKFILPNATIFSLTLLGAAQLNFAATGEAAENDTGRDRALYSADQPVEFKHMNLRLTFTPEGLLARSCEGRVEYSLRPRFEKISSIRLEAVDLRITGVSLPGEKQPPTWSYDDKVLTVVLPKAASPDETLKLAVDYELKAPLKGMHFILPNASATNKPVMVYTMSEPIQARYWFPANDWPNARWTSDIEVTAPTKYTAVANGVLVGKTPSADGTSATTHWRNEIPTDPHLMGMVLGELVELRDEWRGRPVVTFTQPGSEAAAKFTFRHVPEMLELFSHTTGFDFPYPGYTHITVVDHHHGGMEHAGFSFVSPQYISDREEGDWPLEQTESWLIAHMLGHQWFGGIVNYRSVSQAWLNEGFATYLDTLWSSHHEMPDRLQYEMHYKCRNVAASDSSESGKPMVNRDLADPDDIYEMDGSKIYNKGAWVIHMLRLQLGDERFWLGVRNYLHDHQWQGVETTDLRQALEKVSGRDLEQFFQQWVYGHGVPRLEVSYAWDAVRKLARVTVSQTQNTEAPTPAFAVPLEFCFRVNGNDTNITAELRDARQEFAYPFPTEPKLFCVDPRGALLKTLKVTMPRAFWSEQVRHGPTALTRLLAVEFLGKEPSPETVSTLGQVLTNQFEFWGVRQAAARELGSMQTDEALQALLRAEQSGLGHSKVLATTVQSIGGYIVSRHAHEVALKYANPTQPLGVETSAIQALGHLRATPELTERARGIVLAATAKTSRRSVRHTTFSALHSLDDVSGYETIFALAQPNTDDFRTEAIGLLGQLGRNDELRDRTRAALTEWLYDPDSSAQSAAISALGRLGDPHSISDLERIRTSARDESQRNGAERAIAAINRPENPKQSIAGLLDRLTALEKQIQALEKPLKSPTGPAKPSKEVSKNKKPPIPKSAK